MKRSVITWMLIVSLLLSMLPSSASAATPSEIEEQITETYEEALIRAEKRSFDGYCGDYVNWHLLILGINTTNVAGHGKDQYDNYKNLTESSGGCPITAYSAKKYTLESALNKLTDYGTRDVFNLLVGFQRTDSSPRYGHVFFIHGIIDGVVYYSESYDCTIDGTRYPEGSVIACTIDQMATYYGYWATFEGIIHFGSLYPTEMTLTGLDMPEAMIQGNAPDLTGTVEFHRNIDWVWAGVEVRGTAEQITQAQCSPNSYACDLGELLSRLDLAALPAGDYTLNVHAAGDDQDWELYSRDFTVYPSEMTLTGLEMPDSMVEGAAPALTGAVAYHQNIEWLWVGVDTRGAWDHIIQTQCNPNSYTCDITELLSELDLAGLPAGDYTLSVHATGGGQYWKLCARDFTVEKPYMKASDIDIPDFYPGGEAPSIRGTITSNQTITWVWAGVDSRATMTNVLETESEPMAYGCDIASLAAELDFAGLEAGEYTFRLEGISGGERYVLCEQDFRVFVPTPEQPFADVQEDDFCCDSVLWAVENGVTQGVTGITFGPEKECTRAQVVTFLWRAAGCPEPDMTENPFVDVQAGSFYEKAALWAVENGITTGTDATHFSPYAVCNRAGVVTFLHRAAGTPAVENTDAPFTDVPADSWFTEPVLWAVEAGITNGITADKFGPNANCTRAQVVTFLYRAYND